MTLEDKEKVQGKIKKLLKLAGNNPNPEEATAAFLKAQELLLKHKIEMHELDDDSSTMQIGQSMTEQTINTPWARNLAQIIAKNFRCMMFMQSYGKNRYSVFFGEVEDAEVACSMYDYAVVWLNKAACNYATKMRNTRGIVKGVKQDFILGFLRGLSDMFEEQIHKSNEFALAVVVPVEVKEAYNQLELKTKTLSSNMATHGSREARAAGYNEGRNFKTNRLTGGK